MNYRNLLLASILTGIVASCSSNPKDNTSSAVPDISQTGQTELIEVNASLRPPEPSASFKPAVTKLKPAVTRKRIEFIIGDEGPVASGADNTRSVGGPMKLAPSYPERPVPARGMSRDMVAAQRGQPANKLAGTGGSEVWDYGTYRVFFQDEHVAFTKVW